MLESHEELIKNQASPPYLRVVDTHAVLGAPFGSVAIKVVAESLTASRPRSKTIGSDRDFFLGRALTICDRLELTICFPPLQSRGFVQKVLFCASADLRCGVTTQAIYKGVESPFRSSTCRVVDLSGGVALHLCWVLNPS